MDWVLHDRAVHGYTVLHLLNFVDMYSCRMETVQI